MKLYFFFQERYNFLSKLLVVIEAGDDKCEFVFVNIIFIYGQNCLRQIVSTGDSFSCIRKKQVPKTGKLPR